MHIASPLLGKNTLTLCLLLSFWALPLAAYGQRLGLGPVEPHKEIGKASATFSEPKGQAQIAVQTDPLSLIGTTRDGLFLSPSFIVFGRKVVAPQVIEFEFLSYSPQRRFSRSRGFQIVSQGRSLYAQPLVLTTSGTAPDGIVTEVLVAKIPYKTFVDLIQQKSLNLIVGNMRFALDEGNIEALRDLKRMIDSSLGF
jgi:hypothetical protein